jgi:hypothetical protein
VTSSAFSRAEHFERVESTADQAEEAACEFSFAQYLTAALALATRPQIARAPDERAGGFSLTVAVLSVGETEKVPRMWLATISEPVATVHRGNLTTSCGRDGLSWKGRLSGVLALGANSRPRCSNSAASSRPRPGRVQSIREAPLYQ